MDLEAERLRQRTTFDLEMMRELGFCSGIENYSRHLSRREAGSRPWTLLDYFPPDWLLVVDESHMTIPQVVGMYKNDRTRKEILVDFGFRLPSALDNRPLTFEEFEAHLDQVIYMSRDARAPTSSSARSRSSSSSSGPTGIVDPVTIQPTEGQIDDLIDRIRDRVERGERVLVTTLTKKMAEDLADYLHEMGVKVSYLHCEVDTLERVQILRDLRLGVYDVLVGINLLREGIDLPEVTLVAILDADKEGFLRSAWSLIQVMRPRGAQHRRRGRHVRRPHHRVDAGRDRRDEAPARKSRRSTTSSTASCRRRSSRASATSTTGCARWPRPRARTAGGRARELSRDVAATRSASSSRRWRRRCARRPSELEFERAAAMRDEIQTSGCACWRRTRRSPWRGRPRGPRAARAEHAAASDVRPTAKPSERMAAMKQGDRRGRRAVSAARRRPGGHLRHGAAGRGGAGRRRPDETGALDEGTAADWLPGIRDEHEGDDAGWMARWLDRQTWDRASRPTSSSAPASGRHREAAAGADAATSRVDGRRQYLAGAEPSEGSPCSGRAGRGT